MVTEHDDDKNKNIVDNLTNKTKQKTTIKLIEKRDIIFVWLELQTKNMTIKLIGNNLIIELV
jgi:hypothetical protein